MNITIEKVKLEDFAPTIFKIVKQSFSRDFDPPTESVQEVLDYLEGCEVYGVFDEKQAVGYFGFKLHEDDKVELKSIALLPEYQGKGIGKRMMERVQSDVGQKIIWLVVHPENVGAIASYMKSGFIPSGWKDDFFGDGQPRLVMESK